MKTLFTLVLTLLISSCQQPDFFDTTGEGHRYADMRGKWMILNYWATWCAPCIKEIPELNKLAQENKDRLLVFGVNFDQPQGEEMLKQVARMKIEFPVYAVNPAASLGIATPEVLPTTFIFDPKGNLHATLVGPQTEESLLHALE